MSVRILDETKTVGILVSFAGVPISENKIKQEISLFGNNTFKQN